MPRVANVVPAETDLLCEGCGYTLNGLPESGNCPECGQAIRESAAVLRQPPVWEQKQCGFFLTTGAVLLQPTRFYRDLATRAGNEHQAALFGSFHLLTAAMLLALASLVHLDAMLGLSAGRSIQRGDLIVLSIGVLVGGVIIFALLKLLNRFAARLTAWEAEYRGIRLPYRVVLRGMHYHAAHYVPVALVAALTIVLFQWLVRNQKLPLHATSWYLYALCAEVIIGAAYLFNTYWIAMRNMMFANR